MNPRLDAFRAAVMADPAAQQALATEVVPEDFAAKAMTWATAHGLTLEPADLHLQLAPDPLGIRRFDAPPQSGAAWPPVPWLPIRVALDGEAGIDWVHFAGEPVDRSFYADSIRVIASRPFNKLFRYRTPLEAFASAPREAGVAPSGFVFHMSRCGSTLVSQMLGAAPGFTAISEPEPLDALIQLPTMFPGINPEWHLEAVRAMILALCRDRTGDNRHAFIKLDSWHTLALPLLRAAFPDTPWVFLYRDPVEVLVSQARMRGAQTAPGVVPMHVFGMTEADAALPDMDYTARILAVTCEAAIAQLADRGIAVDYRDLPEAVFTRILPHFGITPDAETRAAMQAITQRNAKTPDTRFTSDSGEKQREASDEIRTAAETHLAGVYARLTELSASSPR